MAKTGKPQAGAGRDEGGQEPAAAVSTPEPSAAQASAEASPSETSGRESSLDLVLDVPLRLTVEIGGTELYVREVLQLDKGSVVELDRMNGEPADVLVNGRIVGRGEVTVVDDRLAVRVVELVGMERAMRPRR